MKRITLKVQDPIVWEYPYMRAMNANRLAKGNIIINEAFADRVIEVSPDGRIVCKYTGSFILLTARNLQTAIL